MRYPIRIGTRGSTLALRQTTEFVQYLQDILGVSKVEVYPIRTQGDIHRHGMLDHHGIFVKEIEEALLRKEIDLAIHSLKDLPTTLPPGLTIAAIPPRKDPRDCLVAALGRKLCDLPPQSTVGTGSPRRSVQILAKRRDLQVVPIRGNVTTRLKKVEEGALDAVVVAYAGLLRLGLEDRATDIFAPWDFVPAPGQGALACETRCDEGWEAFLSPLHHPETAFAVSLERTFLAQAGGGCRRAIAAWAESRNGWVRFVGMIEGKKCFWEGPQEESFLAVSCLVKELEKNP